MFNSPRHRAVTIGRYWAGLGVGVRPRARIGQGPPPGMAEQYAQQYQDYYGSQPQYQYENYQHGPPVQPPMPAPMPPEPIPSPPVYDYPEPPPEPIYQDYPEPPPHPPVYDYPEPPPEPPVVPAYQEQPPQYRPGECPPMASVCPTSDRRYHLGFSQDNIAPNAQVIVTARPQYLVRFDRLIIPSNLGQFFDLNNIAIGNVNQTVAAGAISGVSMSEVATYVELGLDTAYPGIEINLIVTNIDAQSRNFRATLIGVLVA